MWDWHISWNFFHIETQYEEYEEPWNIASPPNTIMNLNNVIVIWINLHIKM